MKQEDIIRMAREAGLIIDANQSGFDSVEAFAALVAATEREACAKVCEDMRMDTPVGNQPRTEALFYAANNIRARGQA
jgi:hypothetical protein